MAMTPSSSLTPKQEEANRLLGSAARYILLRGGSRSGKTFLLVRAVVTRALMGKDSRHLITRLHNNATRGSVFRQTFPEVMAKCYPGVPHKVQKAEMIAEFPNGSEIWFGGLDDKDRVEKILGQEYATIYANEVSQIPYPTVEILKTRLAQVVPGLRQKFYFDCNPPPRSHWTYKLFKAGIDPSTGDALKRPEQYAELRLNPMDNIDNLDEEYIRSLEDLPARARTRFLEGEWGADNPYALWQMATLDEYRVPLHCKFPDEHSAVIDARRAFIAAQGIERIVIAIDPPVTSGENADECGMMVVGIDDHGEVYVIDDLTTQGLSPEQWARHAVRYYDLYQADRIVAEVNNGGEMVEAVIRQIDENVSYKAVRATRGKATRAEPVSALYEKGRAHHLGTFEMLEQQMCDFTSDFDPKSMGYSPDRVDALVWGVTELVGSGLPADLATGIVAPDDYVPVIDRYLA